MARGAIGGGAGRKSASIEGVSVDEDTKSLRTNLWVWDADGLIWVRMTQPESSGTGGILSNPPEGHYKVTNVYINSQNGKLVVEYDDTPV